MKNNLFFKQIQFVTVTLALVGVALLVALFLSDNTTVAQPMTFVSPLSPQQTAFFNVPYYGAKRVTAYFDHEFPNYQINNRIVLYDGRVIPSTNGACGWNNAGQAIAYCAVAGQTPCTSCIWYEGHSGNDFSLDYEPVLASANGTVFRAGWQDWGNRGAGYGLHLRLSHASGYETIYGHLSALTVITNAMVSQGQIIGTSGDTGNSAGAHLHFEVRLNGAATDPFGSLGSQSLWRDGSWNAQGRWVGQPEPRYGTPLVVDDDNPTNVGDPNDNPYFTKGRGGIGGTSCPPQICDYWYRDTSTGWDGDMLYTYILDTTPDYWVKWIPPRSGLYDVQVWIPSNHATTWEARYWLVSTYNYMPSTYMIVDQWGTSNRWISLGIHQFGNWPNAPWLGFWISDRKVHPSEHGRKLGVDAMRFRTPWPVYIPLVLKNY